MVKKVINNSVVFDPHTASLSAIYLATMNSVDIQNKLNLNNEVVVKIMSECLKAELTIIWFNLALQKEIANQFFNLMVYSTIDELESSTSDVPEFFHMINVSQKLWVDDIINYYIAGRLDEHAKDWVTSISLLEGRTITEERTKYDLTLKLHYRISSILGERLFKLNSRSLYLYNHLSSSYISSQKEVWSHAKFKLINPN